MTLKKKEVKLDHTAKMASLGNLVAGVAHELSNPVGFILSNIKHLNEYINSLIHFINEYEKFIRTMKNVNVEEFIAKTKKQYDFDFIVKDLREILLSSEEGIIRIKDIVNSLKNFSRLSSEIERELDINTAVENVLKILKSEFKNRILIHKDFGRIPKIKCFTSQIEQVLTNIIMNAAQAIKEKGNIWIRTLFDGSKILIEIKDDGQGIDEKDKQKIFESFFTTKAGGTGTGLGLNISQSIVEKHGGEIRFESKKGKGAMFAIIFPLKNRRLNILRDEK